MKTLEDFYIELMAQMQGVRATPMGALELNKRLQKTMYGAFSAGFSSRPPMHADLKIEISEDDCFSVDFSDSWLEEMEINVDETELALCMCSPNRVVRELAKSQWEKRKREATI